MAYAEKRHHIRIPIELGETIIKFDMMADGLNKRAIWFIKEGIKAHPELQRDEKRPDSAAPNFPQKPTDQQQ